MIFLLRPSLRQICLRCQSLKCLHCSASNLISSASFLICPLQQISFNNVAAEMCSLRMWQWQMSNYRSDIHVSHLRPARPTISPTDAECEMRELRLSTEPPRKAAWPILACHPSLVPLGCHSCVTAPLPQNADPTQDTEQVDQISLWDKREPACFVDRGQKESSFLWFCVHCDIFINKKHLMQGSSRVIPRHAAVPLSFRKSIDSQELSESMSFRRLTWKVKIKNCQRN